MTDPDEVHGSAVDRRFREELRKGLEAAAREGSGTGTDVETDDTPPGAITGTRPSGRSRSDLVMDWAPLVVAVLAIVAVVGIALYGLNGGDLGPW